MRIYQSSFRLPILLYLHKRNKNLRLNILLSYGRPTKERWDFMVTHRKKMNSLILDCGTWTLNNAKPNDLKYLTLPNYINYTADFGQHYDFYFNYDEDFSVTGFTKNYQNQLLMEKHGLNPVPVVHDYYGHEVDHYIERGYDLVALGSYEGRNVESILYAVEKLARHDIKIHLFGKSSYRVLSQVATFSCDSSSWAQYSSFGFILFWNPYHEKEDKTDYIAFEDKLGQRKEGRVYYQDYKFKKELEEHLNSKLAITTNHIMGSECHFYRQLVNALYYAEIENILNNRK